MKWELFQVWGWLDLRVRGWIKHKWTAPPPSHRPPLPPPTPPPFKHLSKQTHEAVLLELNTLEATPIRFTSSALSSSAGTGGAAAPASAAASASAAVSGPEGADAMDEDN